MNRFVSAFGFITTTISYLSNKDEIAKDNGVLILTDSNFKGVIDGNKYVLVKFYAPWCPHSQALHPEYLKVGKILAKQKPDIIMAQVDTSVEKTVTFQHHIKSVPVIKFLKRGERPAIYPGEGIASDIVKWVLKQTNH